MKTPERIAVIRTDRLGDMVLTLPMFIALRERFPNAYLTLFTRKYVQALVKGLSCIDDVVYVDDLGNNPARQPHAFRDELRARGIDTVFFPRATFGEVWSAFRAGVRNRIGTANRWYSLLYTTRIQEHRSRAEYHEAEYNVRMISHAFGQPVPVVRLVSPVAEPAPYHAKLTSNVTNAARLSTSATIIIHPGSASSAPRWSAGNFGEVARRLRDETGQHILITGVESEADVCAKVAQMCPDATNACGAFTLGELISVISGAQLLIANSTGTLHLAASLGVPVVGLYPNSPAVSAARWGPYTPLSRVLSSTANDDMSTIAVDDCVRAAIELLA